MLSHLALALVCFDTVWANENHGPQYMSSPPDDKNNGGSTRKILIGT
ncbi:hypothetical protein RSAG8_02618, partial [Rhizoctonia solani AG-8 WAC10335]